MDYKDIILESLNYLKKKEAIQKQPFKVRAYQKVIDQIEEIPSPIVSKKDLKDVKGIGKKIDNKLNEIFSTGKLQSAILAREENPIDLYDALLSIHGIGPTKAKYLIEDEKIRSIEDLKIKVFENPKLISKASKIGLTHYEDFHLRIPREEMYLHDEILHKVLSKGLKIEIVGSYRRNSKTSGDIDVLVKGKEELFKAYIYTLQEIDYITDILSLGPNKCLAVCKVGIHFRRIDFLLTESSEFAYKKLYFTGSKLFNVAMRRYALQIGWSLSEHGLERINALGVNPKNIRDEKDIFTFLGLEYVKPENRIDERNINKKS